MRHSCLPLIGSLALLSSLMLGPAQGEEVVPGIQILHGIYASLPDDDLKPLKRVVRKAPVVALGESIHTSGGYSRLKYRVFRYLVEEMGFRAFAFESPWDPAQSVGAYVDTCDGTPEEAIRVGLFSVWQNESVRDLVKWMCVWNHRHPDDRVFFFGFDMQQPSWDAPALRGHLERFGLPANDPRVEGIARCSRSIFDRFYAASDYRECVKRLDQLARYFDRREAALIRRTSAAELEWARIRLLGFRAWQDELFYLDSHTLRALAARDAGMAEIFLRLRALRYPGVKTVIWAHNFHIEENAATSYGVVTMGSHLAAALGADYKTLGLIGYRVSIDWPAVGCGEIPVPDLTDDLERIFHDLGEPYLFVDLDFRGKPPFLEEGRRYRLGGPLDGVFLVPREHYDGLFFLDVSEAMNPLAWPPCDE